MNQPCIHGHIDGVTHLQTCYQCRCDALEQEKYELQLKLDAASPPPAGVVVPKIDVERMESIAYFLDQHGSPSNAQYLRTLLYEPEQEPVECDAEVISHRCEKCGFQSYLHGLSWSAAPPPAGAVVAPEQKNGPPNTPNNAD